MASSPPEATKPYWPMPMQESNENTPEHDVNTFDSDYVICSEPTVQIDGELDLAGGWVLRRYVNTHEGDAIRIYLERRKVARAIPRRSIEEQVISEGNLPRHKGYIYVRDDGENPVETKEAPTARGVRAKGRQRSRYNTKLQDTANGLRGRPAAMGSRATDAPQQEISRRLLVNQGSAEGGERRYPDALEEAAKLSDLENAPKSLGENVNVQTLEQTRSATSTRKPTHPSSLAQNIAGLGAPRRNTQLMDGLREDLIRQSATARLAKEALQTSDPNRLAGPSAESSKRKSVDVQSRQKRLRGSHASNSMSDHLTEGEEEADEVEMVPQPPAKEEKKKKKRGRPREKSKVEE